MQLFIVCYFDMTQYYTSGFLWYRIPSLHQDQKKNLFAVTQDFQTPHPNDTLVSPMNSTNKN